jgi:hypothetical protein
MRRSVSGEKTSSGPKLGLRASSLAVCAILALLPLVTGCWLMGERFATAKVLEVKFPQSPDQEPATLSTNDAKVDEALRMIDSVLNSHGCVRDTNISALYGSNAPIVSYSSFTTNGLRLPYNVTVYLATNRLEVMVSELTRSSHLSPVPNQTCDSLRHALRTHYGARRVEIQKR